MTFKNNTNFQRDKKRSPSANKKIVDLGSRGKYNYNNKLNNLTGKEWIRFSKSWFIHKPPKRKEDEILHPAKFPESLIEEFISFFTKEGEWVFDPFMGTGSTLIAAVRLGRNSAGIELSKEYWSSAKRRVGKILKEKPGVSSFVLKGSSENLGEVLKDNSISSILFDFTITSPPYWNQLERNSLRQKMRKDKGLSTKYSDNRNDIGNIKDYDEFIEKQAVIFDKVFDFTKPNGYLTLITNNVYFNGKLFPLAFDTAVSLTKRGNKSWIMKDEKIWLQDDKPLIALGVNNAWVANRHHQYCLVFRKEGKSKKEKGKSERKKIN
ncbi:MAG TPA: DNA methyltransferase [Ignavibacteriaceae bacterium]|nr:DNA methyltransferase [Ignavibacteriaceae bacterium]